MQHHRPPPRRPGEKPHPELSFGDHYRINEMVAKAGALAILTDSNKPDRLFNMSRGSACCDPAPLPMALLTHEDYDLIYRWSQHGPVQMKINLQGDVQRRTRARVDHRGGNQGQRAPGGTRHRRRAPGLLGPGGGGTG